MSRLMLCGAISWLVLSSSATIRGDDAEDKAAAFLEKLGGQITRDEKLPGKPVISVGLAVSTVNQNGLRELTKLKSLTSLNMDGIKVTYAGVLEIAALKTLTHLSLNFTDVTDSGLKELAKKLTSLTTLEMRGTKVTDAGLKELAILTNLTTLEMGHTKVTDVGLKELAILTNLVQLRLDGTNVTDAGLKELAPLTQLRQLHLGGPNLTDAGLKELATLTNLTELNVSRAKVTVGALNDLQAALPKCMIRAVGTEDKNLIGRWELANPKKGDTMYVYEFSEKGKFTIVNESGDEREGTYTLNGTKIDITIPKSIIRDYKGTWAITKLTDDEFVFKGFSNNAKEETWKKIKPKK